MAWPQPGLAWLAWGHGATGPPASPTPRTGLFDALRSPATRPLAWIPRSSRNNDGDSSNSLSKGPGWAGQGQGGADRNHRRCVRVGGSTRPKARGGPRTQAGAAANDPAKMTVHSHPAAFVLGVTQPQPTGPHVAVSSAPGEAAATRHLPGPTLPARPPRIAGRKAKTVFRSHFLFLYFSPVVSAFPIPPPPQTFPLSLARRASTHPAPCYLPPTRRLAAAGARQAPGRRQAGAMKAPGAGLASRGHGRAAP